MKKIKSNLSVEELENIVDSFCKANIQEIEFNDIKRICEQLGCVYYDRGNKRKKGSQESFMHKHLDDNPHFNGIVSIHLIHGGGSKRKVYKRNFVKYMAPGLKIIIQKIKQESKNKK